MPGEIGEVVSTSLSSSERADFVEIVESGMHIKTRDEFFKWTQAELQLIFPHGMLVCGVGRLGKDVVQIQNVMGCNFPDEYIQALQRPDGLTHSPIIQRWLKEQQPILFEPDCEVTQKLAPPGWLDNFHRYGLVNLAAHGQRDADSHSASYFSFSRIPGSLNQRHAYLLKLLVPHLHTALMRVLSNPRFNGRLSPTQQINLSAREKEVLKWMSDGKSNWEIAQVIGLSESTVKNHVHHILGKLHVGTRAQAVAKAIKLKFISAKH
ncbi:MAG: autoinducer binding domain-containing protein [Nitrosomonadales bacterium]|nr:autoinducer binding domain-containing protein [Nitrosomonadales bacterium]